MAEFPTYIPDTFVARVHDPVRDWLTRNEPHPIVQKLLTYYGVATVGELTNATRAATFAAVQIWQVVKEAEVETAVQVSATTARESAENDFVP